MTRPTHPLIVTPAEAARNLLRCPDCAGIGEVPTMHRTLHGRPAYQACDTCGGTGRRPLPACGRCGDSGYRDVDDPDYGVAFCDCAAGRLRMELEAERVADERAAERRALVASDPLDRLPS